jgi:hypothetical protein
LFDEFMLPLSTLIPGL